MFGRLGEATMNAFYCDRCTNVRASDVDDEDLYATVKQTHPLKTMGLFFGFDDRRSCSAVPFLALGMEWQDRNILAEPKSLHMTSIAPDFRYADRSVRCRSWPLQNGPDLEQSSLAAPRMFCSPSR